MKLKDSQVDLCGAVGFTRDGAMPDLTRDQLFSFACKGCGDCCRGREDIVLSGYDLYRIAKRLNLPPRIVASSFCRSYVGKESLLPVLRLAPRKDAGNNCPFLYQNRCSIHDAKPLACALYPLAQEISAEGRVSYFLQPVNCGGKVFQARVRDYLALYSIDARETEDLTWALTCMKLGRRAEQWQASFEPVLLRRLYQKLTDALYYSYELEKPFRAQLEGNLAWFEEQLKRLEQMQIHRSTIKKTDG